MGSFGYSGFVRMNPEVENLKIDGEVGEGNELKVIYDYSDENGDEETESIITWYAIEKEDGEKKAIGTAGKKTLSFFVDLYYNMDT